MGEVSQELLRERGGEGREGEREGRGERRRGGKERGEKRSEIKH
jgi:hypothetical protein